MPNPGSKVGDYRLERLIGKGGFGEVHAATSSDGARVALKIVSLTREGEVIAAERLGALLQRRFEQEHGMVPKVLAEPDEDEHYFYIPMEFVDAPALSTILLAGPLQPSVAARHAATVCEFLEKAHGFETAIDGVTYDRIIHADLKPAHILIPRDGAIKVLDFGIAKALEKNRLAKTVKFGTPHYMSPERLDTKRANEHDDMWALGVMLYEIVSGHRPYSEIEGPYPHAALCKAIETNAPREPLPAACPPDLMAIVHKLLNHQLERRYPNAGAIKNDLNAFLRGKPTRALRELATPETIKIASKPTPPWTPSALSAVPPTTPLPVGPQALTSVATAAPARVVPRQALVRRVAWAVALLLLTTLFTMEAVAWVGAERMRAELTALDVRQLTEKRQDYERLQRWSLLHLGPRLRLVGPLKDRLVAVAGTVIADYSQEEPIVAEVQWRQASDALAWASQLSPEDRSIAPKKLVCDGHLDRITAQSRIRANLAEAQQIFKEAIAKFQHSARLDTRSADPYLGLSRVYIYGLGDVDLGAAAIREAENRGHEPGWRESAQLGDGYLRRGDKNRRASEGLDGEPRRQAMEGVRDDYARCVQYFTPIVGHGKARSNLVYCQRRLDAANRDLAVEP